MGSRAQQERRLGLRSINSHLCRKQRRVYECRHDVRRSVSLWKFSGSFSFITEKGCKGYKVRERVAKQVCGQRKKVKV